MKKVQSNKTYFEFSWKPFNPKGLKSETIIVNKKPTPTEKDRYFRLICQAVAKVENASVAFMSYQEYDGGYIDLGKQNDFYFELFGEIYIGPLRV